MAAKSKLVGRSPGVILFLSILIVCGQEGLAVDTQNDGGKQFLDEKEADVIAIAGNATANNNNCGSLNTCSSNCSRVTCNPTIGGQKSLTCTAIDNNENFNVCPSSNPRSCNNTVMLLDYTQSFVRLPDSASTANLQPGVAESICLQKPLDSTFKSMSPQTEYTLVYFASVSGAFRAFPGRITVNARTHLCMDDIPMKFQLHTTLLQFCISKQEQNQSQCTSFDPRRRPWYLNGISVNKDVKILVDVSASMSKQVPIPYNQNIQYLNVAQNITRALLQTFSPGDYVEVLSFDSQTATSLTGAPVPIDAFFDSTPDSPELHDLIGNVSRLSASQDGSHSNLTGAIVKATQSFQNSTNFSSVIIVLTNGQFAAVDAAFPTQFLVSSQTKLMIYKLDTYDTFGTDEYLLNTTLEKAVCSVSGSFEVLDAQAIPNPLYAMRSYFTFLARTQLVAANYSPTWTLIYNSVSQNINTTTVTFPAFGNDGQLIGVAAVNVVVDGLNSTLQASVLNDFGNRLQGTRPAPTIIPMNCSYQTVAATGYCPNSPTVNNLATCQNIDNSISFAERTCCRDCEGRKGLSKGAQIGIGIGVVVGAFISALFGSYLLYKRHKKNKIIKAHIDIHKDFPGTNDPRDEPPKMATEDSIED